ncbi:f-box domain contaning protein [Gigaspora margarita]|uniref:F-box domain contaning protein n=1 Tax=Gigaspora margarita TaxID=4874 RepID=A0A8H3ZX07_GIGMA|nr:f-box domain contaning protein [Gigaspora margarita]
MFQKNIREVKRKQKSVGICIFTTIPPEMFINICQYLPPVDLLSLARVCKRFNGFLSTEHSITTQEIWRASRAEYLPFLQMPPPDGMSERQYIRLVFERGCQFCGKGKIRKVYWEYNVRSCEQCLKERTIRQDEIQKQIMSKALGFDMPNMYCLEEIISGLTFIPSWSRRAWDRGIKRRPSSVYWIAHVIEALEEYKKIPMYPPSLRREWLKQKREEGAAKMKEVVKRKLDTDKDLRIKNKENSQKKLDRLTTIKSKFNLMKLERNSNNCLKYDETLDDCPSYRNYTLTNTRLSTQPFTDRAWSLLRKKLEKEYEELCEIKKHDRQREESSMLKGTVFQLRQFDIYKMSKQWRPDPKVLSTEEDSIDFDNSSNNEIIENITTPSNIMSINSLLSPTSADDTSSRMPSVSAITYPSSPSDTQSVYDCYLSNWENQLSLDSYDSSSSSIPTETSLNTTLSTLSEDMNYLSLLNDIEDWFTSNTTNQNKTTLDLLHYLPWCPSFKNPPFHNNNPYILWDDQFLMNSLMPQIWNEALALQSNSGPIKTVQGAVLGGYKDNKIFKCKLCNEFNLSSYRDIRFHLYYNHKITHILDEEMIEVVPNIDNQIISHSSTVIVNKLFKLFAEGYNFMLLKELLNPEMF